MKRHLCMVLLVFAVMLGTCGFSLLLTGDTDGSAGGGDAEVIDTATYSTYKVYIYSYSNYTAIFISYLDSSGSWQSETVYGSGYKYVYVAQNTVAQIGIQISYGSGYYAYVGTNSQEYVFGNNEGAYVPIYEDCTFSVYLPYSGSQSMKTEIAQYVYYSGSYYKNINAGKVTISSGSYASCTTDAGGSVNSVTCTSGSGHYPRFKAAYNNGYKFKGWYIEVGNNWVCETTDTTSFVTSYASYTLVAVYEISNTSGLCFPINYNYSNQTNQTTLTLIPSSGSGITAMTASELGPGLASSTLIFVPNYWNTYTIKCYLNNSKNYSYYIGVNSVPTTSSYTYWFDPTSIGGTNSTNFSYSFSFTENTIYVYQQYWIWYYDDGSTINLQSKIHNTNVTLYTNSQTKTSYRANGWNTKADGTGTSYASGYNYSGNSGLSLHTNWTALTASVTIKTMTSDDGINFTNTGTGGNASVSYYYNSSNKATSGSASTSMGSPYISCTTLTTSTYRVRVTATANSGYICVGVAGSGDDVPWSDSTSYSFNPISGLSYTIYAYFVKLSNNTLYWTDENGGYWYFLDGEFPQSYVASVDINSLSKISYTLPFIKEDETENIEVYTDGTNKYAKYNSKYFLFEPIKWRVSDYGVAQNEYPEDWEYGTYKQNFTVVSDLVLWAGVGDTSTNQSEGWSFTSSALNSSVNSLASAVFSSDNNQKHYVSSDISKTTYYYGETGQQQIVKTTTTTDKLLVADEADIKASGLTDMRAKCSDFAAYLLTGSTSGGYYCDYWTRELGVGLGNGYRITSSGAKKSSWLTTTYGVRFSITMTEGSQTGGGN